MKKVWIKLLGIICCSFFTQSALALEAYILDPSHTAVIWHISHFGFSNPSGKWMASGTLVIDPQHMENTQADVTIQIASLTTGVPQLDEHLKSADFFDALKYPQATFVSHKVEVTGKDTAELTGILTLHGQTHPVTLDVTLNRMGTSPITHKKTLGFTAKGELKRSDFGINAYLPGLSNQVKLEIEVEAATG
jgi:polyisoprenoid-binding protein YceI